MDDLHIIEANQSRRIFSTLFAFLVLISAFTLRLYSNRLISTHVDVIDFGDYTAAINGINLLATFMLIGSDTAMLKFMSQYFSHGDLSKAKGYLIFFIRFFTRCSLVLLVISSLAMLLPKYDKNFFFEHYLTNHIVIQYFWLAPLVLFALFLAKLLRILTFKQTSQIFLMLASHAIQIILLLWMHFHQIAFTIKHLILVFMLSYTGSFFLILLTLTLVTPAKLLSTQENFSDKSLWISITSQIFIANFFFTNLPMIIIVADKMFDTQPKNPGYLSLIVLISSVFWLSTNATQLIYGSAMQKTLYEKNYTRLQLLVNEWTSQIIGISLVLLALFYFFHAAVLGYFGQKYTNLLYPTLFYMITAFPALFVSPLTWIMMQGDEQKKLAITAISSCIAIATLGIILIHVFNLWGALWIVATLELIAALVPIITLKKSMNLLPYRFLSHV